MKTVRRNVSACETVLTRKAALRPAKNKEPDRCPKRFSNAPLTSTANNKTVTVLCRSVRFQQHLSEEGHPVIQESTAQTETTLFNVVTLSVSRNVPQVENGKRWEVIARFKHSLSAVETWDKADKDPQRSEKPNDPAMQTNLDLLLTNSALACFRCIRFLVVSHRQSMRRWRHHRWCRSRTANFRVGRVKEGGTSARLVRPPARKSVVDGQRSVLIAIAQSSLNNNNEPRGTPVFSGGCSRLRAKNFMGKSSRSPEML